ncbi:hypothetical protein KDJ56_04895 [Brevibacillus composti]|uniref:Cadherin-like domain-containing protein n=1 Tax=Brevibacillus composti TaxID=2796470 RepID=A0A7T5EMF9_9BACL|nr:Ig-like domain-containing protein [Brevibacillus composti]QQE75326.1 hypothetical protein JD108_05215 [Brevibacillus composti]QUO42352.1 hypothetical protein KDJ56_04895 [Brevibacillus composti]
MTSQFLMMISWAPTTSPQIDPQYGSVRISGESVIYTPAADHRGPASFTYRVEDDGTTLGAPDPLISEGIATVSFDIQENAKKPSVTGVTTLEDTMSAGGLEITPNDENGVTTSSYKISHITGGTLYPQNGGTPLAEGRDGTDRR